MLRRYESVSTTGCMPRMHDDAHLCDKKQNRFIAFEGKQVIVTSMMIVGDRYG